MRPVSPEFLEAVAQPHSIVVQATLLPPGADPIDLPLTDGSVTLDRTSANRGSCDVTVPFDEDLVPKQAGDPLLPHGTELKLSRGLVLPDGTEELVGLGVFVLDDVEVTDAVDSFEIRVSALDRSMKVQQDVFEKPYSVPAGTLFTEVIKGILSPRSPGLVTDFVDSPLRTPIVFAWEEQSDPWSAAQDVAMAMACDLYYDGDGVAVLRQAGQTQVQLTLSEGEGGVLVSAGKRWTRDGLYNRWIVTSDVGSGQPLRGVATDDDPSSPTRYGGPFGKKPRYESLDYLAPTPEIPNPAQDVAEMLKARQLGLGQVVDFGAIVNPALEPDDVVQIIRERAGIQEAHTVDSVAIPLKADQTMSGATRAQKVSA